MSISPTTPSFSLKSFWQRPEGKTGMLFLVATVIAGLYGASLLLPWAIAFATDALHLIALLAALVVVLYTVNDKSFRSAVGNLFRLSMRWFTSMVIEIDPIGILENTVDKMVENNEKLAKAVAGCAGAKVGLEQQIRKNNDEISHAKSLVEECDRKTRATQDQLQLQRLVLSRNMELQEIGRRMKSNDKFQQILSQTTKMYVMLGRWQNLAEFNIDNTKAEVANAKQERKAILEAYKGLGFAQKIIKGDPEQLKMMNASLEFLAEDNANKLGAMEDFARYSEKFLTNMDLEQGASAVDAEKMLAQYEQKLLSAGAQQAPTTVQSPATQAVSSGDYLDYK